MFNNNEQKHTYDSLDVLRKLKQGRLFFKESTHKYSFNDATVSLSVTKFIEKFKEKFDREFHLVRKATQAGLTIEVLSKEWEYLATIGKSTGNIVHSFIENYLENNHYEYQIPKAIKTSDRKAFKTKVETLLKYSRNFVDDHYFNGNLTLLAKEYNVGLVENGFCYLAGKIDNLSITDDGRIILLDYKTDKKLNTTSVYNKKLLEPFSDIEDCELSRHSLQLNTYKVLFEHQTGLKIDKCLIVWFNVENDNYKILEAKKMQKLTYDLLRNSFPIPDTSK